MASIKGLRGHMGLLQRDLARQIGVKTAAISHYERGLRRPRYDIATRIVALAEAAGYEMDLADVLRAPGT